MNNARPFAPVQPPNLSDLPRHGFTPVPERYICCVLRVTFRALSINVNVPSRMPGLTGENTTPSSQEFPVATEVEVEQVVVPPSVLKFALGVMPLTFIAKLPMFATVNVCAALFDPTAVFGKFSGAIVVDTFRIREL